MFLRHTFNLAYSSFLFYSPFQKYLVLPMWYKLGCHLVFPTACFVCLPTGPSTLQLPTFFAVGSSVLLDSCRFMLLKLSAHAQSSILAWKIPWAEGREESVPGNAKGRTTCSVITMGPRSLWRTWLKIQIGRASCRETV